VNLLDRPGSLTELLDRPLSDVMGALKRGEVTAVDLVREAIVRHDRAGELLSAYKIFDLEGARAAARAADERIAAYRRTGEEVPPLLGIPVSVKDLYGVDGFPTFAGTPRQLPARWSRDGWLVGRLRQQGAVFVGKTHTVEFALGGVGVNPHWGTPRNPWDAETHRVPGGSSSGAGVSLWEGSALIALGSDTGGSIRIPASMTGTVGLRTTTGRWPTDGVVPLSPTLDVVGALTRSVEDARYVFDAVEGTASGSSALVGGVSDSGLVSVGVPQCKLWSDCQSDIVDVLEKALGELAASGWVRVRVEGSILDEASRLYLGGAMVGAEFQETLEQELPAWRELLHPIVATRLEGAPTRSSPAYTAALAERSRLASRGETLFGECDVLAMPTVVTTPPAVDTMADPERYVAANRATLAPTSPASILGLCALTLPVGLDRAGMPVGLQLVAPPGADEKLLTLALAAERVLGTALERVGRPPLHGKDPSS